jgi:hypothetical protein
MIKTNSAYKNWLTKDHQFWQQQSNDVSNYFKSPIFGIFAIKKIKVIVFWNQ